VDEQQFGEYRLEDRLKSGGFADIFLAMGPQQKFVVLRRLRPEFAQDRHRAEQCRAGCRIMQAFDHPNVIKVLDHGEMAAPRGGTLPFCVMEYVDGPSLGEAMRRDDPLATYDRMGLMLCMANGLTHIHDRGYLHLDFKPDNVLISATRGDVKIIDFDLARPRKPRPQRIEHIAGTLPYVCPEELSRHEVDERADIFSFGVTAYELWTGEKPVEANSTRDIPAKYANLRKHLRPPRALNPGLPANVEKIILRCLEQDPAARYPAMAMVLRDLAAD
jgi:serine/threonine-protein kinase